ncbi:MAG: tripartite tricarboxylate transporter substrate binding protein [Betaproteobacteria bacterium]|nr:tripartite tricarboxylate transporter substrate binding protein [Betaproteobacteria bacterium]
MKTIWMAVLTALALPWGNAQSQAYPNKPIRMVVGFPPGGGTDVVARIITPKLSENLGQPVVIENRPGATGTVAAAAVAKSPADGYTIMMGHVSVNAIAPSLFPNLPYDVIKDFAPVTLAASVPHFIVVHPSLPVTSIRELIAYAKARPGKLSFPSAGNGSTPHLSGEMFKSMTGIDLVHVPHKGTGQSIQDLLAGQHQVAFDTVPASTPYVRSGRMRVLAVSSAKRLADSPEVPTVEEAGVPGYQINTWYGVFAPAGTPEAIVHRLHAEIAKAMHSPETRSRLTELGADGTETRSPEEFAAIVRADTTRYAKIIRDAGLKMD